MNSIRLNDGNMMPIIGFGTYLSTSSEVQETCRLALEYGYRHIDSAQGYKTEVDVGVVLKEWNENHSDTLVFITTKLWPGMKPNEVGYEDTIRNCENSLSALGVQHIDLYLIHGPFGGPEGRLEQWKAFVHLQESGKCRSIGVSNYSVKHLEEIKASGMPMPVANQLEIHPLCQHRDIVEYCQKEGILVIAYSSLVPLSNWREGQRSGKKSEKNQSDLELAGFLETLSKKYGVSSAQILLKWALQHNYAILPKSINPERIKGNFNLFGFSMTKEEMDQLDGFDRNEPVAWPIGDPCLTP